MSHMTGSGERETGKKEEKTGKNKKRYHTIGTENFFASKTYLPLVLRGVHGKDCLFVIL